MTKIALVGNAPKEKYELLNSILDDETVQGLFEISIYGGEGESDIDALRDAIEDCEDGIVDGVACLPLSESLHKAVKHIMAQDADGALSVRINSVGKVVAAKDDTTGAAKALAKSLKRDFDCLMPRIAVLGDVATETLEELSKAGVQAFGPYDADGFYEKDDTKAFDGILEQTYGQTKEAQEKAADEQAITLISSIKPVIAQGEAEDLLRVLYLLGDVAKHRHFYDIPFKNPLPKLYHERKEDSERARFAKNKGFNPAEHKRENVNFIKKAEKKEPASEKSE